jgi:hypothetical protein
MTHTAAGRYLDLDAVSLTFSHGVSATKILLIWTFQYLDYRPEPL